MTLLERARQVLAAAPSHAELVLRLRGVVKDALASGTHRDEVLRALEGLRTQEPAYGDVALDVMDFLAGWSSPHVSLRESSGSLTGAPRSLTACRAGCPASSPCRGRFVR